MPGEVDKRANNSDARMYVDGVKEIQYDKPLDYNSKTRCNSVMLLMHLLTLDLLCLKR